MHQHLASKFVVRYIKQQKKVLYRINVLASVPAYESDRFSLYRVEIGTLPFVMFTYSTRLQYNFCKSVLVNFNLTLDSGNTYLV